MLPGESRVYVWVVDAIAYQESPALPLAELQRQQREISALRSSNRKLEHQQAQINWLMHHARLH